MNHHEKLVACVQLGVEMRAAQVNFFRNPRNPGPREHWLKESRKLEKQFDEAAKYVLALATLKAPPA